MRHTGIAWFAALALSLASGPAVSKKSFAASQDAKPASQSPAEIARLLAEQGKISVLPAPKGKVKRKIEPGAGEPYFRLPYGETIAVLFKLPDYSSPYLLKVVSLCNCNGLKKNIFVPSGDFLDAEFKPTHRFEESELKTNEQGYTKAYNFEAVIQMNDERKTDRYLLIYTRADLVGKMADKMNIPALEGLLFGGAYPVSRSAFGTLELETVVEKKK